MPLPYTLPFTLGGDGGVSTPVRITVPRNHIRYPAGWVTPYGARHVVAGTYPQIRLKAFDDSIRFDLQGGLSIADPLTPEAVRLKSIRVSPEWKHIDQKGATEDGVTNLDTLYGPCEIEVKVDLHARNPQNLRRLRERLQGSIDPKRTSELSWLDGPQFWWADVRHSKASPEATPVGDQCAQELTLVLRADTGFVRSFDHVDQFTPSYESLVDLFDTDYSDATPDLGPSWPQRYDGDGGGFCTSDGKGAYWFDDPADTYTTLSRRVVNGPRVGFNTATDNQVASMTIGAFQEWTFPEQATNSIFLRMGRSGSAWNGNAVELRIEGMRASWIRHNGFAETVLREMLIFPPVPGETFTAAAGFDDGVDPEPRLFKAYRNGTEMWGLSVKESGTGSVMNSSHRGVGHGMKAAAAWLTQATPANVVRFNAGDNTTVTQSGHLTRINVGSVPMHDRLTFYGPGVFGVGNGPDSSEMVQFGPLLPNQIVQIRTSPGGVRGIVDLTSTPPKQQELDLFQQALKDVISWASGNNVPPLLQQIESLFGILPPQGNLYSLLSGRFSRPIPGKSPGRKAQPYHVAVSIDEGSVDSKIIASGTPQKVYPI